MPLVISLIVAVLLLSAAAASRVSYKKWACMILVTLMWVKYRRRVRNAFPNTTTDAAKDSEQPTLWYPIKKVNDVHHR